MTNLRVKADVGHFVYHFWLFMRLFFYVFYSISDHQPGGELDLVGGLLAGQLLKKCVRCCDALGLYILMDCGEGRSVYLTQHVVIETNYRDVLRNGYTSVS